MQRIVRTEFRDCTIIAVAHRLNTIMVFDRVAVLDRGVFCELDSPEALWEGTLDLRVCGVSEALVSRAYMQSVEVSGGYITYIPRSGESIEQTK